MTHCEPETLRAPIAARPPRATYPQKRGRPATGKMPTLALRAPDQFRRSVEQWAAKQTDKPRLSEAIRRLVDLGLTVKPKVFPSQRLRAARADRAKELAAKTIEKIIDPAAPPEERAQWRRRLTKGPAEFQDARVDQPKVKR